MRAPFGALPLAYAPDACTCSRSSCDVQRTALVAGDGGGDEGGCRARETTEGASMVDVTGDEGSFSSYACSSDRLEVNASILALAAPSLGPQGERIVRGSVKGGRRRV